VFKTLKDQKIVIREAVPQELDEVALLLKEAYIQYELDFPEGRWGSYLENIMDVRSRVDDAQLIVAEINGVLVGSVTLYLDSAGLHEEGWPAGWAGIRLLGVHPKYRGYGIGKVLMEECIRRCRENGIHTLGLHTSKLMEVARRMYEKMGFQRVSEYDFHPAPGVLVLAYKLEI